MIGIKYKKAFTLVELIFSMVIIAIVFTVVPKLMFATTKTMEFSIKEDGMFAAAVEMGDIEFIEVTQTRIRETSTVGQVVLYQRVLNTDTYPVIPVTGFVRMLNIAGMIENHSCGLNSCAVSPSHGRLPMI